MQNEHGLSAMTTRWEQSIRDIEAAFGIGITIHDPHGCFSGPQGWPVLPGRHLHPHAVCERRSSAAAQSARCVDWCQHRVRLRLEEEARPFLSLCWKGISEVVVPIIAAGRIVLILFGGPFRAGGGLPVAQGVRKDIREMIGALPVLDDIRRETLTRVLQLTGQGLWAEAGQLLEGTRGAGRKQELLRFLHERAHEGVDLPELAAYLHLSPSRAGHLVKELFGRSFRQMLTQERLRRARALLLCTNLPAQEIAERTGFGNPYYFSRIFHAHIGMSPLAYRRAKGGELA